MEITVHSGTMRSSTSATRTAADTFTRAVRSTCPLPSTSNRQSRAVRAASTSRARSIRTARTTPSAAARSISIMRRSPQTIRTACTTATSPYRRTSSIIRTVRSQGTATYPSTPIRRARRFPSVRPAGAALLRGWFCPPIFSAAPVCCRRMRTARASARSASAGNARATSRSAT